MNRNEKHQIQLVILSGMLAREKRRHRGSSTTLVIFFFHKLVRSPCMLIPFLKILFVHFKHFIISFKKSSDLFYLYS